MSTSILIPATTSAVISSEFTPYALKNIGLIGNGLINTETITVEIEDVAANGGTAWVPYMTANKVWQMNSQNNVLIIWDDCFKYRLNKSVTASPVGVSLNTNIPA